MPPPKVISKLETRQLNKEHKDPTPNQWNNILNPKNMVLPTPSRGPRKEGWTPPGMPVFLRMTKSSQASSLHEGFLPTPPWLLCKARFKRSAAPTQTTYLMGVGGRGNTKRILQVLVVAPGGFSTGSRGFRFCHWRAVTTTSTTTSCPFKQ